MTEPPGGSPTADGQPNQESWVGLTATPAEAMEWGIDLCGQLATVHRGSVVVGRISPATIVRGSSGRPELPEPAPGVTDAPWVDVSALAKAIGSIVPDPPPELTNALLPPYASAVALGQELQDAQRAMGLPVAPIPVEDAPPVSLGGLPPEAPSSPPEPVETDDQLPELDVDPAELARNPNMLVLLIIVVVVLLVALAIGIGW